MTEMCGVIQAKAQYAATIDEGRDAIPTVILENESPGAQLGAYFPAELREFVEVVVERIAAAVGSRIDLLRLETTLEEIIGWARPNAPLDPLDRWAGVTTIEEELGLAIPEEFVARAERCTFRELAEYLASIMR